MRRSVSPRTDSRKRAPFARAGARARGDLNKAAGATRWYRELLVATMLRTSIKLQNHLDRRFRSLGMTAQEASVVVTCVDARRTTPGALARTLARDKGKVTRFIQRLVARNLLRRQVQRRDRRIFELEPTSRGRVLASRLRVVFEEIRRDLFAGIPAGDVERVGNILTVVLANMSRAATRGKHPEVEMCEERDRPVLRTNEVVR